MSADTNSREPSQGLTSERTLTADAVWFKGHFPGDPLLPGVAQIQLVLDTVNAALGASYTLKALRRIRFRDMIRPNDRVQVKAWSDAGREGTFQFRIKVADTVACTGTIEVKTALDCDSAAEDTCERIARPKKD